MFLRCNAGQIFRFNVPAAIEYALKNAAGPGCMVTVLELLRCEMNATFMKNYCLILFSTKLCFVAYFPHMRILNNTIQQFEGPEDKNDLR